MAPVESGQLPAFVGELAAELGPHESEVLSDQVELGTLNGNRHNHRLLARRSRLDGCAVECFAQAASQGILVGDQTAGSAAGAAIGHMSSGRAGQGRREDVVEEAEAASACHSLTVPTRGDETGKLEYAKPAKGLGPRNRLRSPGIHQTGTDPRLWRLVPEPKVLANAPLCLTTGHTGVGGMQNRQRYWDSCPPVGVYPVDNCDFHDAHVEFDHIR